MNQVKIDRYKAQIFTSQLCCSWSILTANLDSFISVPNNFEWIGKSEINSHLICNPPIKEINLLNDIEISEIWDDYSTGVQITLYWDKYRITSMYKVFHNFPTMFNFAYLLFQDDMVEEFFYIPYRLFLHPTINTLRKGAITENDEIAYIETESGQGILFYVQGGVSIDVALSSKKFLQVDVSSTKKFLTKKSQTIKLPVTYVVPYDKFRTSSLDLLHNQSFAQLLKYETWLSQKEK